MSDVNPPIRGRFERIRRSVGSLLGTAVFLLVLLLPLRGVTVEGHRLLAVLALVVVFWVTEAIPLPVTALLGSVLAVVLGVAPAKEVFAPYGDPIIFLFIGSFVIARSMTVHGLDRRFAAVVLRRKAVSKTFLRMLFALGAICVLLSMWMSNTAVAAMMMPFAMCFLGAFRGTDRGDAFMGSGALMVAYAASVGGIATPVGTPPNLITLAFLDKAAGIRITFFEWMLVGVPLSLLMTGVLFIVLRVLAGRLHGGAVQSEALSRCEIELEPKLSRGEVNTLVVFAVVVLLWVAPGVIGILLGAKSRLYELYDSRMPEAAAALAGAVLLFLLPVDGKRGDSTMTWEEASKINWGTILLFGGGLSLGTLMFKTGLGEALGTSLLHVTGTMGLFMLTLVATVSAVVLTEFTSNTATANIVIPVVLSLARALNLPPLVPILGACFGSSMGFMLPVGTPPNAIAYATGRVSITRMLCTGVLIDLASIPAIVLVLYGAHAFGIV